MANSPVRLPGSETSEFHPSWTGKQTVTCQSQVPYRVREDLRGNDYYWIGYRGKLSKPAEGTDLRAIYDGYVSVSPLHVDLTHEAFLQKLRSSWPL